MYLTFFFKGENENFAGINVIYTQHCKVFFFIKANVISYSITIERKHKQINKKTVGAGEEKTKWMQQTKETVLILV